jgi:microcystin-dependent protein
MRFLIYVMLAIIILTQVIFCTVPLTIRSGTTRNYPQTDDLDWGDEATNWAQDVTTAINASPTKTQSQSFDAIVGTSTDVSNAIATHNNLISAISSVNANGNIYLLDGTYWQTSTVTINKAISITGQSDGAVIAGTTGITPIIDVTASGVYLNNFRLDEGTASGGIGIQYEAALDKNKIDISATGTFSGGLINNLGNENSLIGHISFGTSDSRFIGSKINGIKITGTENKKITVTDNVSLNQNLLTTSSPTFNALTLSTSPITIGSYTLSVSGNTALNQPLLTSSAVTFQTVDATTQYKLNGNNVIGYNSGLIALNNFQTVDSTTKGTIQNNITALPNLTSVSGNSFTVSGATTLNQNLSTTAIPTFKSAVISDGTITMGGYNFEITGASKINQDVRSSATPSFQTVYAYQWNGTKANSGSDFNIEATNNIARIMGDTANNTEFKYVLYGSDGNGTNGDNSSGIASSIDGKIAYKNRADNWITLSSVSTANQQLSNLSSVSVNTNLVPASQYNLGAVASPWGTSYLVEGNFQKVARFGTSTPIYIEQGNLGIGFNSYYNGTNYLYGQGTSQYAGRLQFRPDSGTLLYRNTTVAGNGGATATLSTPFVIDSIGKVSFDGTSNVGAVSYSSVNVYNAGAADTFTQYMNGTTGAGASSGVSVGAASDGTGVFKTLGNYPVQIGTNSTTRATFTTSGNTGLGTTTPDQKLSVQGAIDSFPVTGNQSLRNPYVDIGQNITPWEQGFENNISGWSTVNNTTISRDTEHVRTGSYAMKTQWGGTGSGGVSYNLGDLPKFANYNLSGYFWCTSGSGGTYEEIALDASAAYSSTRPFYNIETCSGEWKHFSITGFNTSDTNNDYIWLGFNTNQQPVWYDDVVLTEGSFASKDTYKIKSSFNEQSLNIAYPYVGFQTSSPTVAAHVNGTIRIGDGGETASTAGTGSLRWGTTETAVQYSDGANWNYFAPPGMTIEYAGATCPAGFLLCDGSAISRTTYAALYTAISTTWGTGNGTSTFNIPDLRGVFVRGAGTSSKLTDANSAAFAGTLGTYQNDKLQNHIHGATSGQNLTTAQPLAGNGIIGQTNNSGGVNTSDVTAGAGLARIGAETSPANAALNRCIKY